MRFEETLCRFPAHGKIAWQILGKCVSNGDRPGESTTWQPITEAAINRRPLCPFASDFDLGANAFLETAKYPDDARVQTQAIESILPATYIVEIWSLRVECQI